MTAIRSILYRLEHKAAVGVYCSHNGARAEVEIGPDHNVTPHDPQAWLHSPPRLACNECGAEMAVVDVVRKPFGVL